MTQQSFTRKDLDCAVGAVTAAIAVTRAVQMQIGAIRQHSKDDRSPVTVADYAAQAIIAARLGADHGNNLLVGEEDAATLRETANASLRAAVVDAARVAWPTATESAVLDAIDGGNHDATATRYWTLDPIDGTKGFLRQGQYAISLALIVDGEVELGVLGCPNLSADFGRRFDDPDPDGCTFYATRGGGTFRLAHGNRVPGAEDTIIRLGGDASPASLRLCESVEAAHSRIDESARIVEYLGGSGGVPARLDSQCKYAVVARGQADAYLRLPTRRDYVEKIWDHAAGKLIAEEAGALVTDIRGQALDFGHGSGLANNRGVVCATPAWHGKLVAAIAALALFPD